MSVEMLPRLGPHGVSLMMPVFRSFHPGIAGRTSESGVLPERRQTSARLCLMVPLLLVAAGCKKDEAPAAAAPPPATVIVRTVKPETVPVIYEFVGQTEASKTVEIRARVQGFLLTREFEEGTLVNEGQVLYKIDPRSFQADLDVAKAQRERASLQLGNAGRQLVRITQLASEQAATQKELDDWQTAEAQSRADLHHAEAQVDLATLNLGYTTVTSPLKGKVGRTLKEPGALVDAGSNSLLTTVWQVDPMFVVFSIPEREWLEWKSDVDAKRIVLPENSRRIELVFLDGTKYQASGKFDFFDATVNPLSGTATARAVFENRVLAPKPGTIVPEEALKPGQFVRTRILGWERPDALAVPQRAITQTPNGPIVMVVGEGSKVEVRPIKTGAWFNDEWVVLDGLKIGDRVIVEGLAKARPGSVVTIGSEYTRPPSISATPPTTATPAPPAAAPKPSSASPTDGGK